MQFIFWTSMVMLGYTFAGYPALMRLLSKFRDHSTSPAPPRNQPSRSLSIIIAAHNEGGTIKARINNLIGCDFNGTPWEIIVVSDGSNDGTADIAREIKHPGVKVIEVKEKQGKAACINMATKKAKSEILIFTDARQHFAPDAIIELISPFSDPEVVGVGGELHIAPAQPGSLRELGTYWQLERQLRSRESRFWSTIGCSGAIYAIRAEEFRPIPNDTILDDVVIPMKATLNGGRILFNRAAKAYDPQPLNSNREKSRKQRTLGGNFQLLFRYHEWLSPWGHPLWWQLISHKYLRILSPVFLMFFAISNLALLESHSIYLVLGLLQMAFYITGILGHCSPLSRLRPFSSASAFLFLNAMTIGGFFYYLSSNHKKGWK
jgi:cellulose synthase/poly-beta-1,6-N-acetylglucosamine synthase-like glycosyltransferase